MIYNVFTGIFLISIMNEINKKYDVIILTYEPKDDLIFSLEMLSKQKIKPQKIIIYNTEESLFYNNITNKNQLLNLLNNNNIEVYHIKKEEFDHGKTRNDAIKKCVSNYVLFLTDDAIPFDEYFSGCLLSGFEYSENIAVTYARQIAKNDAKLKEKLVREFNYPDYNILKYKKTEKKYGIKNCFCSNSAAMYDIDIFNLVGGFRTGLTQNEDMLYAYTIIDRGYKVLYNSNAKVFHSHNFSYLEQFNRNYDIGVFQNMNKEIYDKYSSEGEGKKLVKFVIKNLLKEKQLIQVIDFVIECAFRYVGFCMGKI